MNIDSTSEQENIIDQKLCFNEDEWIKLLFLINDTQEWLNELSKGVFFQLPIHSKKKLFRKTFYISVTSVAHILERHYYKIQRHPNVGKFTIPITDLLSYLRDSYTEPAIHIVGTLHLKRILDTHKTIGFDCSGTSTQFITIISDGNGRIVTAFPGSEKKCGSRMV